MSGANNLSSGVANSCDIVVCVDIQIFSLVTGGAVGISHNHHDMEHMCDLECTL